MLSLSMMSLMLASLVPVEVAASPTLSSAVCGGSYGLQIRVGMVVDENVNAL